MTEEELDRLADKIAASLNRDTPTIVINTAAPTTDLARTVTTAIRDAVARGHLPKNVLTAL